MEKGNRARARDTRGEPGRRERKLSFPFPLLPSRVARARLPFSLPFSIASHAGQNGQRTSKTCLGAEYQAIPLRIVLKSIVRSPASLFQELNIHVSWYYTERKCFVCYLIGGVRLSQPLEQNFLLLSQMIVFFLCKKMKLVDKVTLWVLILFWRASNHDKTLKN